MNLAVIPARGGSKRIARKNIRDFCGKPMMAWSIDAAKTSGLFDRIVVSTDDPEIAEVATSLGADVPFVRPAELSDDHTGTSEVISHAISWFRQQGERPDPVCCLYATAPFLATEDLARGLKSLSESGAEFVFPVTSFAFPIQRAIRITPQDRIEMFNPDCFQSRSQDLEAAYHDTGQFYWGRADAWLAGSPIFGPNAVPLVIPRWRVLDIDTEEDWEMAQRMARSLKTP
jgi:N-acylneuraminate cytidylyltransferase